MRVLTFLSALFVSTVALAACGGASTVEPAGGGTTSDPNSAPKEAEGELTSFCTAPATPGSFADTRIFAGLEPTSPTDYLALRHNEGGFDGPWPRKVITVAERGKLCAKAPDAAKCEQDYASLVLNELFFPYVFYTRGQDVGIVRS